MQNVIVECTASKLFSMYPSFRWYPFTKFHKYPKPSLQMNILQKVYCSWKQKTGEDNPSFPDIPIINKKQCWGAQKKKSLNQDSEDKDNLIKQRIITRGGQSCILDAVQPFICDQRRGQQRWDGIIMNQLLKLLWSF